MRIAGPPGRSRPDLTGPPDVATALSAAVAALGHRPAVTVIAPGQRQEQGFVSLAGWAAKGAHLLRDELGLGPGDVLGVDAPPSWPLTAVALAAWWAGVALGPVAPGRAAVLHEGRPDPGGDVLWLGDAIDGGPTDPTWRAGEAWTAAVTPYPDRPPSPGAAPDAAAIVSGDGRITTQRELLGAWHDDEGVLGLWRDAPAGSEPGMSTATGAAGDRLGPLAARPVITGDGTVVVLGSWDPQGVDRLTGSERIARWI